MVSLIIQTLIMKRCFIAIILLLFSFSLRAQYVAIGIAAGAGAMGNSNSSYFPGFGGAAKAGITVGLMLTENAGFVSGVYTSAFGFSLSYDRATVANQSVGYIDVPFALRIILGAGRKPRGLHVYAQPGIIFRSLRSAHYIPESNTSVAPPHVTYEQDNKDEFEKNLVSISLQGGFIVRASRAMDLNFGGEFSTALVNVVYNGNNNSIQGYAATSYLSYLAIHIGLQFHLGGGTAEKSSK